VPDRNPADRPLSANEGIKERSRHLRGEIAAELEDGAARFSEETVQLLKFHGTYQQDDRDRRKAARKAGLERHWQMMIRTRIPGGRVTPEGYLAHDGIAGRWGDGTLRITTRQDLQLHGVLKRDLRASIRTINEALMTTLGGCGDQVRNVMCCPAPLGDRLREEVEQALGGVVSGLTAQTGAYHEIWVDGERVGDVPEGEAEPLYGERYLPRKFKVGIAIDGDNCIDVYSHDLGLVAMRSPAGGLAGFTVLVGGGLGRTHNKPETYPAVARPLGFVAPEQVVELARAVVAVQRDFGDRQDRRHARLKYLLADRGLGWFREQVQGRLSFRLRAPRPLRWAPTDDHLGWHRQADGLWFYGLFVENGRIADRDGVRLRTALREIVQTLRPTIWFTAQQNVLIADVREQDRAALLALLTNHGVPLTEETPNAIRHSMACPAVPTCGLAVAEAERALPALIRELHGVLAGLGLAEERLSVRMTGCPNGCARPYLGDVGLVGTTLGKYDLLLGGDFEGTRLNELYAHNVPLADLVPTLRPMLEAFAAERGSDGGFGDWCHQVGLEDLRARFAAVGASA
jgi:sulfite reductase (ferredoxin)